MLNEHTNLIADGARHSLLSWTVGDTALEVRTRRSGW